MSLKQHTARIGLLLLLAGALLSWLSAHTEVLFADGLRYVRQAQALDRGAWSDGLVRAVDHPVYPLEIVAVHHVCGGTGPDSWQAAAQGAAVVAGVLLVVPLYLVAWELFGAAAAGPGCLLMFLVPLTGHVFADALSESTFLLFWTWGLWTALRFLREGRFVWLPPTIGLAVLAYLSRPEGLLLPLSLVAVLGLLPFTRRLALPPGRYRAALGLLVIGPLCLIGPYVALKGGIGTKPSIARLLGTAPRSLPLAVERKDPLDPNQGAATTYALAAKAAFEAVRDAVTVPLLPLSLIGVVVLAQSGAADPGRGRAGLLVATIGAGSVLALVRLHATGGYCSPRHALILAVLLIPAAAAGIERMLSALLHRIGPRVGEGARKTLSPAAWTVLLGGLACILAARTLAPVNEGMGGYRTAGLWLRDHTAADSRVVDVTGWSLFYGQLEGYTFANLIQAPADPRARWVVAREAHMKGPWPYCAELRGLVGDAPLVATFHGNNRRHPTKVFVFDRQRAAGASTVAAPAPEAVRR